MIYVPVLAMPFPTHSRLELLLNVLYVGIHGVWSEQKELKVKGLQSLWSEQKELKVKGKSNIHAYTHTHAW